jgi:hypothetical protein
MNLSMALHSPSSTAERSPFSSSGQPGISRLPLKLLARESLGVVSPERLDRTENTRPDEEARLRTLYGARMLISTRFTA